MNIFLKLGFRKILQYLEWLNPGTFAPGFLIDKHHGKMVSYLKLLTDILMGMEDGMEPKELLKEDNLEDYKLSELFEVFRVNEDGVRTNEPTSFFFDENVAQGFIGLQADPEWFRISKSLVLYNERATRLDSDDVIGFLVGGPAVIVAEHPIREAIRENALKKLTPAEIKLLNVV